MMAQLVWVATRNPPGTRSSSTGRTTATTTKTHFGFSSVSLALLAGCAATSAAIPSFALIGDFPTFLCFLQISIVFPSAGQVTVVANQCQFPQSTSNRSLAVLRRSPATRVTSSLLPQRPHLLPTLALLRPSRTLTSATPAT